MLSLDFKLTSAQVRELLFIWHGASLQQGDCWTEHPALVALGRTDMHYQIGEALERKGLVRKREIDWQSPPDAGSVRFECTDAGAAIAEMIVRQAHMVMAVDASRRQRLATHGISERSKVVAAPTTEG